MRKAQHSFYNKSKQAYDKKTINVLTTNDSKEITDAKDILKELQHFYTELYTSASNDEEKAFDLVQESDIISCFTDKQRDKCEGYVTLKECHESLKAFKTNKSPGCDGLPAEFYLAFRPEIGTKLVDCLNYCLNKSTLSLSQRRGVITL